MDTPASWRILRDPPAPAARNMAVDEALARCLRDGEGILRIYRWSRPTLSLGRNQPALRRYDPHAIRALGAEVVRRPTGGREVLHHRELTYSLILPLRTPDGLRGTYRRFNRALVAALRSLGVEAEMAGEGSARAPGVDAGACFAEPAPGEVMARGRKLCGSAQCRIGSALLQHGSLLLAPSWVRIPALRQVANPVEGESEEVASRGQESAIHLSELLGEGVSFPSVAAAVEAAVAGENGGRWGRGELRPDEAEVAANLVAQYESPSWTWRR